MAINVHFAQWCLSGLLAIAVIRGHFTVENPAIDTAFGAEHDQFGIPGPALACLSCARSQ
jgi:hypothetical protein